MNVLLLGTRSFGAMIIESLAQLQDNCHQESKLGSRTTFHRVERRKRKENGMAQWGRVVTTVILLSTTGTTGWVDWPMVRYCYLKDYD